MGPSIIKVKAPRRGSATASTSSCSSGLNNHNDNNNADQGRQQVKEGIRDGPSSPPGKAHRRVSFTTATTMEDPPSVVLVGDSLANTTCSEPPPGDAWMTDKTFSASADTLPSCNRRAQHTTNMMDNNSSTHSSSPPSKGNHYAYSSSSAATSSYLQFSQSFPAARPTRTKRSASRRTSLDSCSTFSSAYSSSCYSTGGSLASLLISKDEAFQRTKLLECVEWLSRHLSRHVVQQLMAQVLKQQPLMLNSGVCHPQEVACTTNNGTANNHQTRARRGGAKRRRASASGVVGSSIRTYSQSPSSEIMASTRPKRHSQPTLSNHNNELNSPARRSCSVVQCKTIGNDDGAAPHDHDGLMMMMEASEQRCEQRRIKTQQSLDRLSSSFNDDMSLSDDDDDDEASIDLAAFDDEEPANGDHEPDTAVSFGMIPPDYHPAALLLVDISGFTSLSNRLSLQSLSETINAYFQRIVTCIQDYGGDVVRFAGDAVMAEWRVDEGEENDDRCVQLATACACQIIGRCSNYRVYEDKAETTLVASLNVHCGIGYGTIVGFHAGDDRRREFLLLGDPIHQASEGIRLGKEGEVVASPQAFKRLRSTTGQNMDDGHEAETLEEEGPRVVFSSRDDWQETRPIFLDTEKVLIPPPLSSASSKLATKTWKSLLRDWDVASLFRLQELMSLYVHPNVVEGELFTSVFHCKRALASASFDSDSSSEASCEQNHNRQEGLKQDQRMLQSEAEIRKVFTVFLQPEISVDVTGDPIDDQAMMATLNQVMVLANRELARFKGRLRQFIVDDKGVVLIANFGLRGTALDCMIETHAMPFAASLRSALQSEANVTCRLGATYDDAYCGVVGGISRHEYAVLGPSVNLAARLMCSKQNRGFLVASGVHGDATGWSFRALQPVKAKGYAEPVPIFEPVMHRRSQWTRLSEIFVGREEELESIMVLSEDLLRSGCSSAKMVLISGSSGMGKSSLMTQAIGQILEECDKSKHSHLFLAQVCCEGDLFRPLSVLGPVLLDILARAGKKPEVACADDCPAVETVHGPAGTALCNSDGAVAVEQFYAACLDANVTNEYIEAIYSLVFHHKWPDLEGTEDSYSNIAASHCWSTAEKNSLAQQVVSILLHSTVDLDLVLLGVDNVSFMDEFSWKVIEMWYANACNLIVLGASNASTVKDFNMSAAFWDYLFNEALGLNSFLHIELPPMGLDDIDKLISYHEKAKNITCLPSDAVRKEYGRELYLQSGGKPRLAVDMIARFGVSAVVSPEVFDGNTTKQASNRREFHPVGSMDSDGDSSFAAHVLQRLDSVPATVRTHLNLAAILGEFFSAQDVIVVMETYRGIKAEEREDHAELVLEALHEAVSFGILNAESNDSGADIATRFGFTHGAWRKKILQLTLNSWRDDILGLVEQNCGCSAGSNGFSLAHYGHAD
ncbi:cyclase type 10 [Seminavis robusta]|uniref:Cyclase type 10 n=1 Tax=Seminavis robusta TaxID=568900 RepID=A0A9N8EHZ6_9STRA|nr:cyclase type 10 [Seminavis robusta]|eukprot:Sro1195_g251400.1 cyclase type 10 (1421) ;mRNA; r:16069-20411